MSSASLRTLSMLVLGLCAGSCLLYLPGCGGMRDNARGVQSKNNLKQIGLALHNYHDVEGTLPPGTMEVAELETEQRTSWLVAILRYAELSGLDDEFDKQQAWNAGPNERPSKRVVGLYLHPGRSQSLTAAGYGVTSYVGLAGVGADSPTLPVDHKRAGMFGYTRAARFSDVTDGLSNTLMVSEAAGNPGAWAAGGNSTVRGLTAQPYIGGPDGLGGFRPAGANMLFADGAVRWISAEADPAVLEKLVTIAGGEQVGEQDLP
ncbi:MAG: DUF1559 domain-containing protein [Planctomycetaceae bacterium]|nr:DUF1559 domain-containing protein [Planctomycetaceae bacterium]